ncbi:MAG: hypothetical protein RL033_5553 [Pseudomonadota bacterium]
MAETTHLLQVARWAQEFLTLPHPELGRGGQVCPYVRGSIRERGLLLALLEGADTPQTDQTLLRLGQYFLQLEPTEPSLSQRKAIVVLFPGLGERETADAINGMHQRLKPHFLSQGMMLGEFYAHSQKPGLHNPEFRPLRSDTPLLVIRIMVLTDIAFLTDEVAFVRAFLRNFKAQGREELRRYVERRRDALGAGLSSMLLEEAARSEA